MSQNTNSRALGIYCKAYYAKDVRRFPRWASQAANAAAALGDDAIVYLQSDLVVTADIFQNEHVLFDRVDEEWRKFCRVDLGFELPADLMEGREE